MIYIYVKYGIKLQDFLFEIEVQLPPESLDDKLPDELPDDIDLNSDSDQSDDDVFGIDAVVRNFPP